MQSVLQAADAVTKSRYAVLANLPIPSEMPTDMLVPIVIPSPYTLQDFIGTTSGVSDSFELFLPCASLTGV